MTLATIGVNVNDKNLQSISVHLEQIAKTLRLELIDAGWQVDELKEGWWRISPKPDAVESGKPSAFDALFGNDPARLAAPLAVGDKVKVNTTWPDPCGLMTPPPREGVVASIDEDGKVAVVGINGVGDRERFRTRPENLERIEG